MMRMRGTLAVLCAAGIAAADTSRRSDNVDPRRFELLLKVASGRASTVSPAGGMVAMYIGNNIEIVDTAKRTVTLTGHTQNIHDSGWSRDGRFFASSGYDGTVRVWDIAKAKELSSVSPHTGYA
jgi:WD40 repeat protein